MSIKAIAVDIDGTLTNDEKIITPRTLKALIEAQHAGVRVIISSGRPAHGVLQLSRELELDKNNGLLVSYNGGRVENAQTGEMLLERAIPKELVKPLLRHLKQFDVIPWFVEGEYLYVENAYADDIYIKGEPINIIKDECDVCDFLVCEVRNMEDLADRPQCKLLTAGTDTYLAEHWQEMAAPFEGKLEMSFSCDYYFEFMPLGVDKGTALAQALPKLGIDAPEVVAFGDAQNDLGMLQWAGTGVAMGNATDEVKAAADMVTLTNNEDGIAVALEKLLG